jgi:hypothetical protein
MTKRKRPVVPTPEPHPPIAPEPLPPPSRTPRLSAAQKVHVNPEDNIGPFYKAYAAFWGVVGGGLLIIHAVQGRSSTWIDFGILVSIIMLIIGLARPSKFDAAVKTAADAIPLLKFKK